MGAVFKLYRGSREEKQRPCCTLYLAVFHLELTIIILFLKPYRFPNFSFIKMNSFRCGDKLIFCIVMAMDNPDNPSCKFFDWSIYTEQIHIKLFSIAAYHIWDISVIDGIDETGMLMVYTSNRSVYFYMNCFPRKDLTRAFLKV